jgi:heat shock protein HslJ
MRPIVAAGLTVLALAGCDRKSPEQEPSPAASEQPPPADTRGSITDRDWVLVALGEQTSPLGAGNEPATLRLEGATATAVGFAGCNRYRSTFTLKGDSLTFGPVISTKMACADGDELERSYLGMMEKVTTYQASDTSLTLGTGDGGLARFRPRGEQ